MVLEQSKVAKNFMVTVLPLCAVESTEFILHLNGWMVSTVREC